MKKTEVEYYCDLCKAKIETIHQYLSLVSLRQSANGLRINEKEVCGDCLWRLLNAHDAGIIQLPEDIVFETGYRVQSGRGAFR